MLGTARRPPPPFRAPESPRPLPRGHCAMGLIGRAGGAARMPAPYSKAGGEGGDGSAAADEFYGLYERARLLMAAEFEASGTGRGAAAGAARDVATRLAIAFLARDSGLAGGGTIFADGVARALGGCRAGAGSARAWGYIAGEFLPGLAASPLAAAASGPGGGMLGAPIPQGARIADARPAGLPGGIGEGGPRILAGGPAGGTERRHPGLSPAILALLAMSSHGLGAYDCAAMLGRVFEGSVSGPSDSRGRRRASRRKREGAFYTPARVARDMCRDSIIPWLSRSGRAADPASLAAEYEGDGAGLADRLRRIRVLDPACGPGAFLIEAAQTLLDVHKEAARARGRGGMRAPPLPPPGEVAGRLHGMDSDPRAAETARLALLVLLAPCAGPRGGPPPDMTRRIVARNSVAPGSGAAPPWGGEFDVIVGNPPYVRHEELRDKDSMALPRGSGLELPRGFGIPRKSDLASYFHYHSLAWLARGGRLAFIASDGWLSHAYGLPLQRALLDNCRIDALILPASNVFGGADVKTAVLHLTRGPAGRGHRIAVAEAGGPGGLGGWRGGVVARPLQRGAAPGAWPAQFLGAAPAPGVPMAEAGSAGRVRAGVKTGCDGFFVLAPGAAREHGIDGRFLRPVLSARSEDGCLEGRAADGHILAVDEPRGRLAGGVLRYIEAAESALVGPRRGAAGAAAVRLPDVPSLRGRSPWYSLGLRGAPPPVLLSIFTHRRIKVYRNDGRFFARNNFAGFFPLVGGHADAYAAHFASSWFGLHMERHGHVAGGGALQFLVSDFARSPVPDLGRMGRGDAGRLGEAWRAYCADRDRGRLDDAVLEVLGLGAAERSDVARRLEALVARRVGAGAGGAGRVRGRAPAAPRALAPAAAA